MENLKFTNHGDKLNPQKIKILEDKLQTSLPQQYKNFLQRSNGGIPDKVFFSLVENDYVVNQFFSFGESKDSFQNYFFQYKSYLITSFDTLIPIADDVFGNLFCLSLKNGFLFFWNNELDEFTFLCENLNAFLNKLVEDI